MATRTRTKAPADGKIRWRKIGGGSFRLANGKIVKPNETFYARPDEIPKGFRDVVIALDEFDEDNPDKPVKPSTGTPRFELKSKGGGWYDVINASSGKPANSKSMRADEARRMLEDLQ